MWLQSVTVGMPEESAECSGGWLCKQPISQGPWSLREVGFILLAVASQAIICVARRPEHTGEEKFIQKRASN